MKKMLVPDSQFHEAFTKAESADVEKLFREVCRLLQTPFQRLPTKFDEVIRMAVENRLTPAGDWQVAMLTTLHGRNATGHDIVDAVNMEFGMKNQTPSLVIRRIRRGGYEVTVDLGRGSFRDQKLMWTKVKLLMDKSVLYD